MKTKVLLIFISFLTYQSLMFSQEKQEDSVKTDQEKVQDAVLNWAEENLKEFNEPRFEKFVADHTDEYMIAKMRGDALEKNMLRLKKQKKEDTYNGSEEDYNKAMKVLQERKKEAEENLVDFHPKVTSYKISFWANVLLDSGMHNYIEFTMTLDDYYKVVNHKVNSQIGDKKDGKIIYK